MFSQEEFAKRVFDSFGEIRKDLTQIRGDISKLHECQARLEGQLNTHLEVNKALENQEAKHEEKGYRRTDILLGLGMFVTSAVALYAVFK